MCVSVYRPMFLFLTFRRHESAWRAFDLLQYSRHAFPWAPHWVVTNSYRDKKDLMVQSMQRRQHGSSGAAGDADKLDSGTANLKQKFEDFSNRAKQHKEEKFNIQQLLLFAFYCDRYK